MQPEISASYDYSYAEATSIIWQHINLNQGPISNYS